MQIVDYSLIPHQLPSFLPSPPRINLKPATPGRLHFLLKNIGMNLGGWMGFLARAWSKRAAHIVPIGTSDNSPPFQRRENRFFFIKSCRDDRRVLRQSVVLTGLWIPVGDRFPALKCRAIIERPY